MNIIYMQFTKTNYKIMKTIITILASMISFVFLTNEITAVNTFYTIAIEVFELNSILDTITNNRFYNEKAIVYITTLIFSISLITWIKEDYAVNKFDKAVKDLHNKVLFTNEEITSDKTIQELEYDKAFEEEAKEHNRLLKWIKNWSLLNWTEAKKQYLWWFLRDMARYIVKWNFIVLEQVKVWHRTLPIIATAWYYQTIAIERQKAKKKIDLDNKFKELQRKQLLAK